MIRREHLRIVITCDGCGQVRQDQDGVRAKWASYPSVWKAAQEEGWSAKKKTQGSDYDHFCRDCYPQKDASNAR